MQHPAYCVRYNVVPNKSALVTITSYSLFRMTRAQNDKIHPLHNVTTGFDSIYDSDVVPLKADTSRLSYTVSISSKTQL